MSVGEVLVALNLVLMDHCIIRLTYNRSLNETVDNKILQYRANYNNRPSNVISFTSTVTSTSEKNANY
jgi:hypothetical protein